MTNLTRTRSRFAPQLGQEAIGPTCRRASPAMPSPRGSAFLPAAWRAGGDDQSPGDLIAGGFLPQAEIHRLGLLLRGEASSALEGRFVHGVQSDGLVVTVVGLSCKPGRSTPPETVAAAGSARGSWGRKDLDLIILHCPAQSDCSHEVLGRFRSRCTGRRRRSMRDRLLGEYPSLEHLGELLQVSLVEQV